MFNYYKTSKQIQKHFKYQDFLKIKNKVLEILKNWKELNPTLKKKWY